MYSYIRYIIGGETLSSKDYDIKLYNQDKINLEKMHIQINEIYLGIIKYYIDQLDLNYDKRSYILNSLINEKNDETI